MKVTFENVHTSDNFHQATAERMTGSAMIPYDSINSLGPFTAEYAGQSASGVGLVKLSPDKDQGLPFDLSFEVGVEATTGGGFSFVGADGTSASGGDPAQPQARSSARCSRSRTSSTGCRTRSRSSRSRSRRTGSSWHSPVAGLS